MGFFYIDESIRENGGFILGAVGLEQTIWDVYIDLGLLHQIVHSLQILREKVR